MIMSAQYWILWVTFSMISAGSNRVWLTGENTSIPDAAAKSLHDQNRLKYFWFHEKSNAEKCGLITNHDLLVAGQSVRLGVGLEAQLPNVPLRLQELKQQVNFPNISPLGEQNPRGINLRQERGSDWLVSSRLRPWGRRRRCRRRRRRRGRGGGGGGSRGGGGARRGRRGSRGGSGRGRPRRARSPGTARPGRGGGTAGRERTPGTAAQRRRRAGPRPAPGCRAREAPSWTTPSQRRPSPSRPSRRRPSAAAGLGWLVNFGFRIGGSWELMVVEWMEHQPLIWDRMVEIWMGRGGRSGWRREWPRLGSFLSTCGSRVALGCGGIFYGTCSEFKVLLKNSTHLVKYKNHISVHTISDPKK